LKRFSFFYIVRSEIEGSAELNDRRSTKKEKIEMQKNNGQEALKRQTMGQGIVIGMVLCSSFEIIFSILIGNFGFNGMGAALGAAVGLCIGEVLHQRKIGQ
jgi:glucose uptake protein GlcU